MIRMTLVYLATTNDLKRKQLETNTEAGRKSHSADKLIEKQLNTFL